MRFFEQQATARRKSHIVIVLFVIFSLALSALNAAAIGLVFHLHRSTQFLAIGFASACFFWLSALFHTSRARDGAELAEKLGGTRIDPTTKDPLERRFVNVAEEMAIASGTAVPSLYVLNGENSINAFASGTDPRRFAVAVTRGALEGLDRDELQAVVGHEFSHLLNEDASINARLAGSVAGFFLFMKIGQTLLDARGRGRSSRRDKGESALLGFSFFVIGLAGFVCGRIMQAFVSREREFLADASSAQFTRQPRALARALTKIRVLAGAKIESPFGFEHAHVFFADVGAGFLNSVCPTHPPLVDRIRRLEPAISIDVLATEILQASRPAELPRSANRAESLDPAVRPHPLGGDSPFETAVTADFVLSSVGRLDGYERAAHRYARAKSVLDDAHDATSAEAGFYAAFLKDQGKDVVEDFLRRRIARRDDLFAATTRVRSRLVIEPAQVVSVLKLALGVLSSRERPERERLVEEARALVVADGRRRWRETLMLILAEEQLARAPVAPARSEPPRSLAEIGDRLFRVLVWASSDGAGSAALDEDSRQRVFNRVSTLIPDASLKRLDGVVIAPVDAINAADDLRALSRLPRSAKARVLECLVAIHRLDSRLDADEIEALRLAALLFGVPVPPLGSVVASP